MSQEAFLRQSLSTLEVNDTFTEACLQMRDGSRLHFCHRVGERWARAVGSDGATSVPNLAVRVLSVMALFRLNGKHLELQFLDGSRWNAPFRG